MKHRNQNSSVLTGCLCALGCEFLFGCSFLFTKNAVGEAGAFALLGWRFLIAWIGMSLLAVTGAVRISLKGNDFVHLLPIALLFPCVYFIGETVGIDKTTATESGVFIACVPAVSMLCSTWILKKKPTRMQAAGILITLIGVLITVLAVGTSSSFSLTGYLFLTIAVLSYSVYSALVEKNTVYTGIEITYVMLTAGAAVFLLTALAEAAAAGTLQDLVLLPFKNKAFLAAILYQGIGCSIIAFFLLNSALARIGVNRTSSFVGVSTVTAILAGVILLGEPFSPGQIAGSIVIILGIYTANSNIHF